MFIRWTCWEGAGGVSLTSDSGTSSTISPYLIPTDDFSRPTYERVDFEDDSKNDSS